MARAVNGEGLPAHVLPFCIGGGALFTLLALCLSRPSKHPVQTISLVGRGRARGGGQVSVEGGKFSKPLRLPSHFPSTSLENHRKTRYIHDFTHVLPRFRYFYLIQNIETHPTCEGARPPSN